MTNKIKAENEHVSGRIPELTPEQLAEIAEQEYMAELEARAASLATKYSVPKVHVYVGVNEEGEKIIGFIKEPSYIQKIAMMDKIAMTGPFIAGDELRQVLTLQEESDPRTYSTSPDCDIYRLAMTSECVKITKVAANTFKKK